MDAQMIRSLVAIFLAAILTENYVLNKFLGICPFLGVSKKLGHSSWWITVHHILPHMVPQFIIGLILLFPHAIMHESGLTFLGFGLSPEQPAIGIILSESMKYLSSGMWWLAFFPGLMLVVIVLLFDRLGENMKKILDPYSAHE